MEIIYFDKQGDVRLVVNKKEQTLGYVVNSVILRLASPVFTALVGPHFNEGNRLRQRTAGDEPIDISLPDDDADALKILLDIMHMRQPPNEPMHKQLIQLATLVDKYQCPQACRSQVEGWIRDRIIELSPWSEEVAEYLGMAVAFASGDIYATISIGLVLTSTRSTHLPDEDVRLDLFRRIEATTLARLITTGAKANLYDMGVEYLNEISFWTTAVISNITRKRLNDPEDNPDSRPNHHMTQFCKHDEQLLARYFTLLMQYNILHPYRHSPMGLLHKLCDIASAVQRLSPINHHDRCRACQEIKKIETSLYDVVKNVLCYNGSPAFRHPRSRVDEVYRQTTTYNANARLDSGVSVRISELFGDVLGERLLEDGQNYSFQFLLGWELDHYR